MGADDDKKKKKKSKKKEVDAAPEPEAEPEPIPEPEAEPEPAPAADEGSDWMNDAPAVAEEDGGFDFGDEVGEQAPPPPPAKKKPVYFVHWDRKKSRFYDYNFDYGENYYSSMVRHLDTRGDIPTRRTFEDRAIRSSLTRKALPDTRTDNLLAAVSKSIKGYEISRKAYTGL